MTLLLAWLALGAARADIIVLTPCETAGKPCVMQGGRRTDGRPGLSGPGICTRSSSGNLVCLPDEDPPECWTPEERRGVWSRDGGGLSCIELLPTPKRPIQAEAEAAPEPAAPEVVGGATIPEPVASQAPAQHAPSDQATAPASVPPAAEVVPAGCGCGNAGTAGSSLVGLLLLLMARRR